MRTLFLTTGTNDLEKIIGGWNCWADTPAHHITFLPQGPENKDEEILTQIYDFEPELIFYIGAPRGKGLPTIKTLQKIRSQAIFIHICCDGGDPPWHPVLKLYEEEGCFDKQISIDGHSAAPVDLVTLTPIDQRPFEILQVSRGTFCGFGGNIASRHRIKLIVPLVRKGLITLKKRNKRSYEDYIKFLMGCKIIINSALTGSVETMHVKGRVLESAFAGCFLLEMEGSPTKNWFPEDLFMYYCVPEIESELKNIDLEKTEKIAKQFLQYAKEHYHPKKIYSEIQILSLLE